MMELCTTTIQPIPNLLITHPNTHLRSKPSIQFPHSLRLRSRLVSIRATSSEESETNAYSRDEPGGVVSTTYEVPPPEKNLYSQAVVEEAPQEDPIVNGGDGQSQISELLENFNLKLDNDDASVYLLFGSGALVLWLASAVIGAIDSIPLFPKLMEVIGLGYTIWFSSRYLIFKKNREELVAKVQVLKQQVLGTNED